MTDDNTELVKFGPGTLEHVRVLVEESIGPAVDFLKSDLAGTFVLDDERFIHLAIALATELVVLEMSSWWRLLPMIASLTKTQAYEVE